MKKYSKPVITTESISDINEPIYMDCSGKTLFSFPGDGWTHQNPEQGRWNFAEQTNGIYKGPFIDREVTTYAYVHFNVPVNVAQWNDSFTTYADPTGENYIVGSRTWAKLNYDDGIGLGALYVVPEDATYTGDIYITGITMTLSYNPSGCQ